jgi:hypothetical protein
MTDRTNPHDPAIEELLDPAVEQALGEALRSAWAPGDLDPVLNEQLIEQALEDPFAPPTADEIVESERLRQALEGQGDHPDARLAGVLKAAASPRALEKPERLLDSSLRGRRSGNVLFVAFGAAATAALAAAAAAMLFVFPAERQAAPSAIAPALEQLVPSRSTAGLFHEKFEAGETSARLDRITSAREKDLRENRYALWGVR